MLMLFIDQFLWSELDSCAKQQIVDRRATTYLICVRSELWTLSIEIEASLIVLSARRHT